MNLQRQFAEYNRKYFHNSLPECRIHWNRKLLRRGYMGEEDSRGSRKKPIITIAIELRNLQRVAKITLLHEMVHLYLDDHGSRDSIEHGPRFQREMLRLAKAGAFAALW